jgi:hypothetical protein
VYQEDDNGEYNLSSNLNLNPPLALARVKAWRQLALSNSGAFIFYRLPTVSAAPGFVH